MNELTKGDLIIYEDESYKIEMEAYNKFLLDKY